ncbi:dihydrolipoamide acetyltransferase family protein [Psychromicrobium lacuslunae]|uniref:Dihydrolipoamide acetyltransferase component of pyruvate dehydrogenase complex n=1 Tax=Psychromicrobium lacuslunae TaxID=1618207 RepID=A0A0D4C116_9MICC|nr:dihydrolipoamide acetyltransferase family protein [Psychromicrobium lacuslunae]AJT42085.1 branched-chain alpha-keto acid dehydrogenase subunit E2 [Psychromicrobium lacuslunae]
MNTFHLPDVGEGLTEAEIVSWKVKVGDTVAINDVLVEIETAKSLVELPSPYAGEVTELLVGEGETVDVGAPIIVIGVAHVPSSGLLNLDPQLIEQGGFKDTRPSAQLESVAPAPLVGSGPKADAVKRRPRLAASSSGPKGAALPDQPSAQPMAGVQPLGTTRVLSTPPVRKAAKDLGIDLASVNATGIRGEVTRKDLQTHQEQLSRETELNGSTESTKLLGANAPAYSAIQSDFDGTVERIPVKGVRKATAQAMVRSAFSAPHVSIFVDVDASRTMEFVKRLKTSRDFDGIKVSPLLIVAKAVIWAVSRNPAVNASWTEQEILIKHFVNLGIAAATPRGLVVPNIKNAQQLSLKELALALNQLSDTARQGRTQPAEMQDGSISITNIGALGLDTGTPILNPGEVGILAFGSIKQKPWVVDGALLPRWVTTLGGSFDHRVVDGDLAARFLTDVAAILEEPALLLD